MNLKHDFAEHYIFNPHFFCLDLLSLRLSGFGMLDIHLISKLRDLLHVPALNFLNRLIQIVSDWCCACSPFTCLRLKWRRFSLHQQLPGCVRTKPQLHGGPALCIVAHNRASIQKLQELKRCRRFIFRRSKPLCNVCSPEYLVLFGSRPSRLWSPRL